MGLLLERDHKPSPYNKNRRGRAAGGQQKYEKLNAEFND
jgi:hypothetical protein